MQKQSQSYFGVHFDVITTGDGSQAEIFWQSGQRRKSIESDTRIHKPHRQSGPLFNEEQAAINWAHTTIMTEG